MLIPPSHVNAIKYTCPRCGIHTCSASCVKKHKQRAPCSGVRNPAAYKKRADLATASSIDQDFNFISGVERSLQRAEDDTVEREIHLHPAGLGKTQQVNKLEVAAKERGIKLIRAPQGLSRRKENTSHLAYQGQNILWTVEWIHQKGWRRLASCLDSQTIGEAFLSFFKKSTSRKRKRKQGHDKQRGGNEDKGYQESVVHEQDDEHQSQEPEPELEVKDEDDQTLEADLRPEKLHFYLHRPLTSSKIKVLIPIPRSLTFKELLKGRTLLEFPTIYVRLDSPESIPRPFMLEKTYVEQHGEEIAVLPTITEPGGTNDVQTSEFDSGKVLEILESGLKS